MRGRKEAIQRFFVPQTVRFGVLSWKKARSGWVAWRSELGGRGRGSELGACDTGGTRICWAPQTGPTRSVARGSKPWPAHGLHADLLSRTGWRPRHKEGPDKESERAHRERRGAQGPDRHGPTQRAPGPDTERRGPTQRPPDTESAGQRAPGPDKESERAPGPDTDSAEPRQKDHGAPTQNAGPDTETDTDSCGPRHRERESAGPRPTERRDPTQRAEARHRALSAGARQRAPIQSSGPTPGPDTASAGTRPRELRSPTQTAQLCKDLQRKLKKNNI